jgi:hypothetical protein
LVVVAFEAEVDEDAFVEELLLVLLIDVSFPEAFPTNPLSDGGTSNWLAGTGG